jgi:hypothetical protein
VDEATADTAAVLRRAVRRTLTIIGGSVAGTAIAWAISTASASADTPAVALVDATQLVAPVTEVVRAVEQAVPLADLGTGAGRAADQVGLDLGLAQGVPLDLGGPGRSDRPGPQVASGGGTHEPSSVARPAGELPAAAPTLENPPKSNVDTLASRNATERALGDGMTRRGSPEPAPRTPWAPLPAAPASAPGTGSSGPGAGGADSPAFAAVPFSAGHAGLVNARALPAAELLPADEPGTQPGVTPD